MEMIMYFRMAWTDERIKALVKEGSDGKDKMKIEPAAHVSRNHSEHCGSQNALCSHQDGKGKKCLGPINCTI